MASTAAIGITSSSLRCRFAAPSTRSPARIPHLRRTASGSRRWPRRSTRPLPLVRATTIRPGSFTNVTACPAVQPMNASTDRSASRPSRSTGVTTQRTSVPRSLSTSAGIGIAGDGCGYSPADACTNRPTPTAFRACGSGSCSTRPLSSGATSGPVTASPFNDPRAGRVLVSVMPSGRVPLCVDSVRPVTDACRAAAADRFGRGLCRGSRR
jgi:hypothetical protein